MTITAKDLNRATLARQLLLRREPVGVVDAVRRVVALQAQQPASPYIALWNRLAAFDPADLDVAFAGEALVKATLMRITLHVVHADDHPPMHTAMQPTLRGARLGDRRFTESGLGAADADALLPDLLEFADRPRTNAEIQAWLAGRLAVPPQGVWWAVRSFAPLLHVPMGGPWSFGPRPSYVASGTPPTPYDRDLSDKHLQTLVHRYLEGFGPASVADVAQFALVQRSRVREALGALSAVLERLEGPGGVELYDVPGAPRPAADTPAPPRLMAMWDSVLLAYADRSRVLPPDYRRLVIRANGDVLPTLLVDGYVAGVWRQVEGGIEATAFHPLAAEAWEGLAEEARALTALLVGRDHRLYRAYDRWWADLPAAEVRVLPG
ncbi:winged helix DNA-binding domain-containing protein [Microbispora cellulosiformans]|uniref:Winged helix DNA-binding domain-containing protein n=1 Tax=Microbispora cellulosiformans TaxID=2614688 RepID=A0A5J5KAD7_9ACTN|nr:winged helix DNA-binding domain-containing protein [Microbispora cellulosiformans]KAA9381645.1 winged helix DNA-binding domain-containing protein [Microbispora cellulosiformans]